VDGTPAAVLSRRYADAVGYACEVHAQQLRKGTRVPYAAHLIGVSSLVLEAGADEDLAIAALLHDAAEDHGGESRLADIEVRFGARVAGVVRACSDSLEPDGMEKDDWETRKREHLARLADASDDTLTVWMADKVHNGRAIVTDLEAHGADVLSRFHAPADRILWYYSANLALAEERAVPDALLVPLRDAVGRLRVLLAPH
jgi:(p)ppGpp synthase/HD superfamily hydrolase